MGTRQRAVRDASTLAAREEVLKPPFPYGSTSLVVASRHRVLLVLLLARLSSYSGRGLQSPFWELARKVAAAGRPTNSTIYALQPPSKPRTPCRTAARLKFQDAKNSVALPMHGLSAMPHVSRSACASRRNARREGWVPQGNRRGRCCRGAGCLQPATCEHGRDRWARGGCGCRSAAWGMTPE